MADYTIEEVEARDDRNLADRAALLKNWQARAGIFAKVSRFFRSFLERFERSRRRWNGAQRLNGLNGPKERI